MSETKLTAMQTLHWPPSALQEPCDILASIRQRDLGAGTLDNVLCLRVGVDMVEIWPALPDVIQRLGRQLNELGSQLNELSLLKSHPDTCMCVECIQTRKGK